MCVLINDENNEDEVDVYDDNDDDGDYNASNVFVLKVCVGFKMRTNAVALHSPPINIITKLKI